MSIDDHREDMAQSIRDCKGGMRHAWYSSTTDRKPKYGAYYIAHRCARGCGSLRIMAVTFRGHPVSKWRYLHDDPKLYDAVKNESLDEWRANELKRLGLVPSSRRRKSA